MRFTVPRHVAAVLFAAALVAALYFGVIFDAHKLDLTTAGICFLIGGGLLAIAVSAYVCYTEEGPFLKGFVVACVACATLLGGGIVTDVFDKPLSEFKPGYTNAAYTKDINDSNDYETDSARLGTGCVVFDAPRDAKAIVRAHEVGRDCRVTVDIFHYYASAYVVGGVTGGDYSADSKTYTFVYPSDHQLDLTLYDPKDAANRRAIPEEINRVPAAAATSTRYMLQFP